MLGRGCDDIFIQEGKQPASQRAGRAQAQVRTAPNLARESPVFTRGDLNPEG